MKNFLIGLFLFLTAAATAQTTAADYAKKGQELSQKGDYTGAIKQFNKAIELKPDTFAYHYTKAYCYLAIGKYDDAVNIVKSAEETFGNQWVSVLLMANFYEDIKDFYKSLDLMENAVKNLTNVPDSAKMYMRLAKGYANFNLRNFNDALADYKIAYKIDSTNIEAWFCLAGVYDDLNKPDSCIYFYNKIINKKPGELSYYNNLGFFYIKNARYTDAIALFKKAFTIIDKNKKNTGDSESPQLIGLLHSNQGFAYYNLGDHKNALKEFKESIEYFPTNSYVYKNRALAYIATNKNVEACKDLYMALTLGFADQYGDEVDKLIEQHCK